jgi:NADH dehydrogenase
MILVVGSNGLLGGMIARRLLAAGRPVKLLVRQASSIAGAETVRGDLKDPASLEAACRGASTVITTATSAQRGGEDTVESVDLRGNRNLIDAAQRAGVRQFVFVSTSHVDVTSPIPLFAAKAHVENHLRASGMPWTILAPHAFMDVWIPLLVGSALAAGQPVPVVAPGRARHSFIAVDDVAEFAVRAVDRPAAIGSRLMLGGPEALSWTDIVSRTSALLGRPVPVQHIQPGEPIPTLPPDLGRVVGGLAAGLEQADVIIDASETARTFGVSLTPIETVLRRLLAGSSA